MNLRASLQKFEENHQFDVNFSCFQQILDNYMFNISTCTLLASSSNICRFFGKLIMMCLLHVYMLEIT